MHDVKDIDQLLRSYQKQRSDIGPSPRENWKELGDEFFGVLRESIQKIQAHYDGIRSTYEANLTAKRELVEKLRQTVSLEISNHGTWTKKTEEVIQHQKDWKTIGFAPKKENEEVWKEFRAVCDEFFDAKKAFFAEIHGKLAVLADKKKALIAKANELKDSTDWKETANKLKQLQQQWKMIGHSGAKTEQKLWKSFRSSCDTFFNARTAFFENKDKENEANLIAKTTLITAIKAYKPSKDKNTAIADLKKFSTDFNAIGHLPMKSKDTIFNAAYFSSIAVLNALKMVSLLFIGT